MTYERLKKCPECELRQICDFLFYTPTRRLDVAAAMCRETSRIKLATSRCDFSTLKKEATHGGKFGETIRGNEQSSKIRKGSVGGFTSELSKVDQEFLEQQIRATNLTWLLGS